MKLVRTSLAALLIPAFAFATGCDDSGTKPLGSGGQGGQSQGGGGTGAENGGSLSLDTSYGDQGIGRADRARSNDQILAATFTANGSILLGGSTDTMVGTFVAEPLLVRFTPAGQPDTTFGDEGFAAFPLGNLTQITSIAALPDGGALAGGLLQQWGRDFAFVIRVDAQGKLDTTFGTSGIATVETSGIYKNPLMTRFPSGAIVVLTEAASGGGSNLWLWRLNENGQIDTTFGTEGHIGFSGDEGRELLVDSNGKLLALINNSSKGSLYRINADGTADATFGNSGIVNVPFTPYDVEPNAIGEILVAGEESAGKLMKLDASGNAIATFGTGGLLDVVSDAIVSVKWLSNGDMLIADADASNFPRRRFIAMKRLDPNGNFVAFDETQTTSIASTFELGAVLLKDDQAFLAGSRRKTFGTMETTTLAVGADGLANSSYGTNGLAQKGSLRAGDVLWSMAFTSKKAIAALGFTNKFFMARLNNGSADPTFGMSGFVDLFGGAATGIAIDAQDRMVTTLGTSSLVLRYDAMGNPDATFGTNGQALKNGPGLMLVAALDSKQRILAGGYNAATFTPVVARLIDNGSLDPSFGAAGIVSDFQTIKDYPIPRDLLADSNGNIVVTGRHEPPPGSRRTFVVRLLENGSVDASFGTGGSVDIDEDLINPKLAARQAGGYWLVSHDFSCASKVECPTVVVALDASGKLDASFGEMGIARVMGAAYQGTPTSIAELPDGSVVVTGSVEENLTQKLAVWRLGKDGSADPKGPFLLPGKGYGTSAIVDGNAVYVGGWAFGAKTGSDMVTLRLMF